MANELQGRRVAFMVANEGIEQVELFQAGKPAAAICHGPWTLMEADLVRGRTLTSWPSLQADIRNAGRDLGGCGGTSVHTGT
jgi:putative intracellular protease/amidase